LSEPEVGYYIDRIKIMLEEINRLVCEGDITNSKREIILFNTNEIELNMHIIMRKIRERK